ncbi:MAG: fibrobacter succinogenes major paralogous domain-containing protein [Bacteroidales bacterium]|nr:fibrobacter succinogenes major paralogous domain-containing protein [Bacteroidales bacterium]
MKKHFLFVLLTGCSIMLGLNHLSAQTSCSTPLDYQGYTYHLYRVGGNCWMRENLRATQYADGSDIPDTHYYNDDPSNLDTYGRLYTYYAATRTSPELPITQLPDPVQGVCPDGWHVPSQSEWEALESSTGAAGFESLISASHWLKSIGTSDAEGFNFLPGGYYNSSTHRYERSKTSGYYMTTTVVSTHPLVAGCHCNCPQITTENMVPSFGYSVRCVSYLKPDVTTSAVFDIGLNSAKCSGNVTFEGSSAVIARGICWNTSPNPTIENLHTTELPGSDPFIGTMNGLTSGRVYYVRAYATNEGGTSYGETFTFTTQSNAIPTCPGIPTVTDIDHNVYNTLQIGNQCWMKENLRTTKFADDTGIELGTTTSTTIAYRYYPNNNLSNVSTYGYLYNWVAVMHGSVASSSKPSGVQGICPTGWHLPSDGEWDDLMVALGGNSVAGNKMKEAGNSHWIYGNEEATNSSGFGALPAGYYYGVYGTFGQYVAYWSTTERDDDEANLRYLYYFSPGVYAGFDYKRNGNSVRCLSD